MAQPILLCVINALQAKCSAVVSVSLPTVQTEQQILLYVINVLKVRYLAVVNALFVQVAYQMFAQMVL